MTPEAAAFLAYLRTGQESATMRTDLPTDGGYLAPPEFRAEVVRGLDTGTWFRTLCIVHEPTRAPQVVYGRRTATATPFAWSEELEPPAVDARLKFGRLVLTPHHMTGEFHVSNGLLAGSNADAQDQFTGAGKLVDGTIFEVRRIWSAGQLTGAGNTSAGGSTPSS